MKTKWKITAVLLAALALPATSFADIIQLQDGRSISGSIKRTGESFLITAYDGTKTKTQLADITRITLTASPEEQAAVAWSTFTFSVNRADDIETILSLHQQFLTQNPQSPHADDVRTSLAEYQKLAQQNPVKFRGRWMPSAQVPVLLQQWIDQAAPALLAYKGGNLADALADAQQGLKLDAQNSNALEIAGLASERMDRLSDAAKYFQTLADAEPGNGLAWHNLAVIDTLQNRQAQALFDYAKALQALPANRLLLDNIAGALLSYSGYKDTAPYQTLARQFAQAEAREETRMAAQGLFRYGATWVTQSLLTNYTTQDAQLGDALAKVDDISHQTLDDQSASRLLTYKSAILAVEKARTSFTPRIMDVGEELTPPAPLALAAPAPLPQMPDFPPPAPAVIAQTNSPAPIYQPADQDNSQPTYVDDSGSSDVPGASAINRYPPRREQNEQRSRQDRDDHQDRSPAVHNEGPHEAPRAPEPPPIIAPVQFAPTAPSFGGGSAPTPPPITSTRTR